MNLSDRKWSEFFIGGDNGIFEISSTSSGIDKNKINISKDNETIPYITRSDISNGINLFVAKKQDTKYKTNEGNVITIGLDTQTVFYQPHKFFTGQNIQILKNKNLNKENALFIITLLKVQMEKFNWGGNGATLGRLARTRLMLPVSFTEANIPDWNFMKNYIEEQYKIKKEKFLKHIAKKLVKIEYSEIESLDQKKWKEFKIEDICHINSGKDIYESERIEGQIPYITSTSSNNGIKYFVSNINNTFESNAISVNRNGSVGFAFYHKYNALYSNDCRKIKLKNYANEYVSLFLTNQIMRQKEKYNYGYKMGTERLKKQYITLPVNDNNQPDYKFMEKYIKNLMYKKYNQYNK